ncbi:PREDICTED: uncharacterized protein LOC105593355 [Cercocebus atys]|uniref:uncharacterized protein LOC105593355 n=1 Tax=Cercocebus atys TaxID=9531 RepID=UPI0005F4E162|nr:PREDICTED: uncharacterized protein LOC105593355 [Cercocebus atys]
MQAHGQRWELEGELQRNLSLVRLKGTFWVPLQAVTGFWAQHLLGRTTPPPGLRPSLCDVRARGAEQQVRGSCKQPRPRPPWPSPPRCSGVIGSAPIPTRPVPKAPKVVRREKPCQILWDLHPKPLTHLILVFTLENSFPSREGQGPRGGGWGRSRPSLATPLPRRCGLRGAKSFLPGRSVKVGGRGHVTVPRPWRALLRPSRPQRSAGHLAKTHRPQPRASPVAAARPQSHRQVQAQPRRECVEPSR